MLKASKVKEKKKKEKYFLRMCAMYLADNESMSINTGGK
jgi:hypothetical protein